MNLVNRTMYFVILGNTRGVALSWRRGYAPSYVSLFVVSKAIASLLWENILAMYILVRSR